MTLQPKPYLRFYRQSSLIGEDINASNTSLNQCSEAPVVNVCFNSPLKG